MNKKKHRLVGLLVLCIAAFIGCSDREELEEQQAEQIVIEHHQKDIGHVEITSITHKGNRFVVEWVNDANCEQGTTSVRDDTGAVTILGASIC
ncbi:hypothetical protein LCM20_09820 [Halobacillus litoralis]|uniref:hypothetical protein n=1 Tax=Halobacillus litoralis TaxID=45668 RepID=UPI001CD38EDA|nr:hypothetical protein [Halobacillus litoralis]MCA0970887.1 hypothetical protein [Halobacillus litoralis]